MVLSEFVHPAQGASLPRIVDSRVFQAGFPLAGTRLYLLILLVRIIVPTWGAVNVFFGEPPPNPQTPKPLGVRFGDGSSVGAVDGVHAGRQPSSYS